MKSELLTYAVSLTLLGQPAWTAEPSRTVSFDCWSASQAQAGLIRCIDDRHLMGPDAADEDPQIAIALDALHRLFLAGGGSAELEWLAGLTGTNAGPELQRRIHSLAYPSEWAQRSELLQRLTQILCPKGALCSVSLRQN